MGKEWTDERRAKVIDMWKNGDSASVIANEMEVSRNAIVGIIHRARVKGEDDIDNRKLGPKIGVTAKIKSRKRTVSLPNLNEKERSVAGGAKKMETMGRGWPRSGGKDKAGREVAYKDGRLRVRSGSYGEFNDISVPENYIGVKTADLESHHCRWPIGDPKSEDFVHCGNRKEAEKSYCVDCEKKAIRHCDFD